MKARKTTTFDIEHGPHLGEFMLGVVYRDSVRPITVFKPTALGPTTSAMTRPQPLAPWYRRWWTLLNLDIKDIYKLMRFA